MTVLELNFSLSRSSRKRHPSLELQVEQNRSTRDSEKKSSSKVFDNENILRVYQIKSVGHEFYASKRRLRRRETRFNLCLCECLSQKEVSEKNKKRCEVSVCCVCKINTHAIYVSRHEITRTSTLFFGFE